MGIWLSFSGFKQYTTCPKHYFLQRIKRMEPPTRDSRHNAIVGTVIQRVFEDFYNEELWKSGPDTAKILSTRAQRHLATTLEKEYVSFQAPRCKYTGPDDMEREILTLIPKTLATIKRETLLGPFAKSEMKISKPYGDTGHTLIGYLDFVIKTGDNQVLIIDGKASVHRDKYVDEDQLIFYAILFLLKYQILPDRLGFLFYSFGDDPELAMKWIDFDPARVMDLRLRIEKALAAIENQEYTAKPSSKACVYCPYATVCEERVAQKTANRKKRDAKHPPISDGLIGF